MRALSKSQTKSPNAREGLREERLSSYEGSARATVGLRLNFDYGVASGESFQECRKRKYLKNVSFRTVKFCATLPHNPQEFADSFEPKQWVIASLKSGVSTRLSISEH